MLPYTLLIAEMYKEGFPAMHSRLSAELRSDSCSVGRRDCESNAQSRASCREVCVAVQRCPHPKNMDYVMKLKPSRTTTTGYATQSCLFHAVIT